MAPEIREPTYFLMASLLNGPLHGYAIAQEASELSEGRVRLTAGTLYGALDRLVKKGLIRETGDELVDGRKRRSYALTDEGIDELRGEAVRMRDAAAVVQNHFTAGSPKAAGA
jgi:PadR family transcriptional regulator, regulatory protein PadR